ncbi:aspartic peptidase domain-containing protein [Microdochium bolleyi]|uniref:Aspartic peptidase domain-containing protein n=1 Tax=Microdochium bolleyi TaxID=196109 RepID=A0A136IVC7_9PEZI|nr:aspartic peptidase domain-containing protein [Microdochium bolleyi]
MRASCISVLGLSAASSAYTTDRSQQNRPLRLPIVRSDTRAAFGNGLDSRGVESLDLANRSDIAYYARLDIGSPPQPQYVLLDTGSYELWVNPDCTVLKNEQDRHFCQALGHYNSSASSTAVSLGENRTLQYGVGSVSFDYYTETIGLGGSSDATIQQLQFGVARRTKNETSGILGLGYGKNLLATDYPNFIDQLAEQGHTQTRAFSVALGSKSEPDGGVVMFGGIDTSKFSGRLQTLPIIPPSESPDGSPRYWVSLRSMSLSSPGSSEAAPTSETYEGSRNLSAFLDTGTTMTLLPTALASRIAADFGGKTPSRPDANGQFEIDCESSARAGSSSSSQGTLDFTFDGVTIRAPRSEMVREYYGGGTAAGGRRCYLGIGASERYVLLGASMLRSAYVVFDQTNHAIHLAQYANCDGGGSGSSSSSHEIEITAGLDFGSVAGNCSLSSE